MNKILYLLIIFFAISCSSNQIIINEEGKVGKGHLKNNLKSGKWIFSKDDKINSSGNYSKNKKTEIGNIIILMVNYTKKENI